MANYLEGLNCRKVKSCIYSVNNPSKWNCVNNFDKSLGPIDLNVC